MHEIAIDRGFDESERAAVAGLYAEAFAGKLRAAFATRDRLDSTVAQALQPDRVLVARDRVTREVLGVCGWVHEHRGALRIDRAGLRRHLPRAAALRAWAVLAPLARSGSDQRLVLDGICVVPRHRGRGVGSALLAAASQLASELGLTAVQLSVVDANPGAERLYRRLGFTPTDRGSMGVLAWLYGFERFTTLRRAVSV
ncbi:GNAT family N-acetyltransferase [Leucobacter musarum]|uniref:GNAT family N-acetyltransferase n=1 Tax=Leucobacter musarum TaxID=1930747 RepID=UPI0006A772FA|nr:GNAT family N-acetyltransferase [Leucobacter musarum]